MNILFLTQIVPYPPDAGPKVKTWNVMRYLANKGHKITLITYVRNEELPYLEHLRKICYRVIDIPIRRSRFKDLFFFIKSYFTRRPFIIERDDEPAIHSAVIKTVKQDSIDIIHADQLNMAQFGLRPASYLGNWPVTVFDAHNAVWTILERMQTTVNFFIKPFLAIEKNRVQRYEKEIVETFDHTLAVSESDAQALLSAFAYNLRESIYHQKITVIPIAVDTNMLLPIVRHKNSKNLITLGTLHYPPNADGIRWFTNEVFPLVLNSDSEATLTIIGKNPPADFKNFSKKFNGSVKVTGYVPDLTPFLEQAALVIVPVRVGGGIRVRILEAFARGLPVITTSVGLEGIDAKIGTDVLVEDTEDAMASEILRVLKNEDVQKELALNGRRLVVTNYDWETALTVLDEVYEKILILNNERN